MIGKFLVWILHFLDLGNRGKNKFERVGNYRVKSVVKRLYNEYKGGEISDFEGTKFIQTK